MIDLIRPEWGLSVNAGFTTRKGGVSQPPYDSLNLATHVGDDPAAVIENRRRLVEEANLPEQPRWLSQVHGARVVHADEVERDLTEADAVWTDQPGQVCAVLVADCVPILLASRDGRYVAAIHAGWKGLVSGVIEATVAALPVPGTQMLASIGPCIGKGAYLVGEEVLDALSQSGHSSGLKGDEPQRIDLVKIVSNSLSAAGVDVDVTCTGCVYRNHASMYSFRRSRVTGRNASFINPASG